MTLQLSIGLPSVRSSLILRISFDVQPKLSVDVELAGLSSHANRLRTWKLWAIFPPAIGSQACQILLDPPETLVDFVLARSANGFDKVHVWSSYAVGGGSSARRPQRGEKEHQQAMFTAMAFKKLSSAFWDRYRIILFLPPLRCRRPLHCHCRRHIPRITTIRVTGTKTRPSASWRAKRCCGL